MLRYVYEQDLMIARFVAQLIPHVGYRGFGNCRAIGVIDDDGKLIAGLVYTNWNPVAGTIEISGAALPNTQWLTRETLRRMFGYAFQGCACQMVVMRVYADNERLLRQLAALGFGFTTVKRLFGRNIDGVVCTLYDEEWAKHRVNTGYVPRAEDPLAIPHYLRRVKEAA